MRSFAKPLSFLFVIAPLLLQLSFLTGISSASQPTDELASNSTQSLKHATTPHHGRRRRHAELAVRPRDDVMLYPGRRAPGAKFTWFVTGMGACGHFNVPSDFIVALGVEQYANGKHCGETITITANGKTAKATVMDECMKCAVNDIDLTQGLYRFFDPTMDGTFHGEWEFGSSGPAAKPPPPPPSRKPKPPAPTSTKAPPPKPSPTSKAHHTTSSQVTATASSQTTATVSTKTSATVAWASSSTISSSAAPVSTGTNSTTTPTGGNIGNLLGVLINIGGLVVQSVPSQ